MTTLSNGTAHSASDAAAGSPAPDRHLWLEDVEGENALAWVKTRNAVTQKKLGAAADFESLRTDLLEILDSKERIPFVVQRGGHLYNFWRDQKNPCGLWRRTTLEEYRKDSPHWEVLLDLDALSSKEGVRWVWAGASLLKPGCTRALIALSRGGADATTTREFDLEKRDWVPNGFLRPEAKGSLAWVNLNQVFVQTDFGPNSVTNAGYPRVAKLWNRGTPLSEAATVYEGEPGDISVSASHDQSPGYERDFVQRNIAFYNNELFYRTPAGELVKLDLPNSAEKRVHRQFIAVELRESWASGGKTYPAGSLLVGSFEALLHGVPDFEMVFEPTPSTALAAFEFTRDHLLLNVLEDVKNRLFVLTHSPKGWERKALESVSSLGRVDVAAVDSDESNQYFLTATDYLTPTTLSLGTINGPTEPLKALPRFFNPEGLHVQQHFAKSKDGTRIPYFLVSQNNLPLNGSHPTLLYGYGGFEISLQPSYSAGVGRAWATKGGVYVVANIRGGGEYGPRWHQAALKENRLRAYEDFAAVAQDLVERGITSARKLAIQGGSNGGLLVGNMVTLYPNLFKAAVCQVPLLDMRRYHLLLAGASWMAEYGNPDLPDQWEYMRHFSPYQNVRPDVKYPSVLFTTSTRDDRVHPGHARKMMARMEEQGHSVLYYENIEGGHGGAANNEQAAFMQALAWTFLKQQLMDE